MPRSIAEGDLIFLPAANNTPGGTFQKEAANDRYLTVKEAGKNTFLTNLNPVYQDYKLFSKNVKVEYILGIFRKLRYQSQVPFVAQILSHSTIPKKTKDEIVRALFYGKTSYEMELIPYHIEEYTGRQLVKCTAMQEEYNKTILAYVFRNANLTGLDEGYLHLFSKFATVEDTKIMAENVLKNTTFEEAFHILGFYLTEKKMEILINYLPNSDSTLSLLAANMKTFTSYNFFNNDWMHLPLNKMRQVEPTLNDLPDGWVLQMFKALAKA